ncbi:MAG: hypothetical protein U0931_42000, partial [Vulcanimicrobiota bacterium]
MPKPTVWIRSQSNQSLGLFLVFLAIMLVLPVPALLAAAEIASPRSLFWSSLPLILALSGLALHGYTRKRFWARPGILQIRDGFALHSKTLHWEGPADIVLSSYEDGRGEWWIVELACRKPHYPLHRCLGEAAQARHLATSLARAIGGSLIENESMTITSAELDLPLSERLRRHPVLLGEPWARPDNCRVVLEENEQGLTFRWKHPLSQVLPLFLSLVLMILMLASAPLFPGEFPDTYSEWRGAKFQRSAWQQLQRQDDSFFRLSAAFLALATLLWAGMRQELHFTPQQASRTTDLWGMRLFTNRLEVAQIREIWA